MVSPEMPPSSPGSRASKSLEHLERLTRQQSEELARANTELRSREQEIRLLFERTSDAVVTIDSEGKIRTWNPRAAALFGWTEVEAVGRSLADTIIPERFRPAYVAGLGRFLQTGEGPVLGQILELVGVRRDGSEVPVEAALVATLRGDSWSFIGFLRDISVRKSAEAELQRASEAALAANRAKSEFLANVSHEIRTPMNGILGMTELALGTSLTDEQREYLETVKRSAKGLLAILNSVLDYSKIEAGKLEVDHVSYPVRRVIEDAVKLHSFRAQEKGIRLFWVSGPDVPERISGDPLRLGQVLGNLVSNALKFTERGEIDLRVSRERAASAGPVLHFAVRDSGMGIPLNKQGLLFKEFSQVDASSTRRFGGTGLGLAICSRLVGLMGGRIWVESEPGKGSTFHFTIALNDARTMVSEAPRTGVVAAGPARRLRILVAEDNPVNQRLAVAILQKRGHEAIVAGDGAGALQTLRLERFDAVLMDVQMPDMDGMAATAAIRRGDAGEEAMSVPIVAMTAHAMIGDRERFMQAGMSDYLSKPVDARELVDVVEGATANSGKVISKAFAATEALERVGGDPEMLRELAVTFVQDFDRMMTAIRDAARARDFPSLEHAGHSIRGAAGIFSATRTVAAARAVEEDARAKNAAAFARVPALEVELKRLRDDLDRLVKEGRL
jgi:PAS domain S-box-containing protein